MCAGRHGGHLVRSGSVSTIRDDSEVALGDKLAVFQALERLHAEHPPHAEIVFLHIFCGMTMDEIAGRLGVPTRTLERRYRFARAWLWNKLGSP